MRTIAAGEFKAKCLAVMDEVQRSGQPITVTKRGRPVVQLLPLDPAAVDAAKPTSARAASPSAFGRLRSMGAMSADIVSSDLADTDWDRLFDEKWARFEISDQE